MKKYEDTSRYSRLKALSDYGYAINWEELRSKMAVIVGVGGVGSLAAELLVRCGIGKIAVIDMDIVEEVNLNRLFFLPEHVDRPKVQVIADVLQKINPDVVISSYHTDLMNPEFESTLETLLQEADLALMGLDNVPARQYLNVKCVNIDTPYVDVGASRSGLGGYVHMVIPHKTACYQCTGAVDFVNTNDVRGKPCTASLPTTIAILASIQVNIALKYLLQFGRIPDYTQYNALRDETLSLELKRDENCYVCGTKKHKKVKKAVMTSDSDLDHEIEELEKISK